MLESEIRADETVDHPYTEIPSYPRTVGFSCFTFESLKSNQENFFSLRKKHH